MAADVYLVALEGVDGSGKSTIAPLIRSELEDRGFRCLTVGEFGSPVGDILKSLLGRGLSPYQKTLFFALDRSLMLDEVRSAIDYGSQEVNVLLWDRYTLSAYVCRQMEIEEGQAPMGLMATITAVNESFPPADLVVFLDAPISVCAKRVVARGFPPGDYDHHVDRLSQMRSTYIDRLPPDYVPVGGVLTPENAAYSIADSVEYRLHK